jgi:hypothetical protein
MVRHAGWCVAVVLLSASLASAASVTLYSGVLSTQNGGILAGGAWNGIKESSDPGPPQLSIKHDNGFQISYLITQDTLTSQLTYQYSVSGVDGLALGRDLSHIVLEVSSNFTLADLLPGSTGAGDPWTRSVELRSAAVGGAKTVWSGQTDTAGVKFDIQGNASEFTFQVVTLRMPMEGTFYAKSGNGTSATASGSGAFYVPDSALAGPAGSVGEVSGAPLPASGWAAVVLFSSFVGLRSIRRRRHSPLPQREPNAIDF